MSTVETTRPPAAVSPPGRPVTKRPPSPTRSGWLFTAPFVVLYLAFLIGPALYNLVVSFFDTSLVRPGLGAFAGLDNYGDVLTDAEFWRTFGHTVWFTVLTTVPLVVISLALALLVQNFSRGRWFLRLAFFAPYVLPSAVIAIVWRYIYQDEMGGLAALVGWFGITPPSFLGDPAWAMASIALATVWWTVGFNFVLYLAALQEIPQEVHEASALDGAGPWQRIRYVIVPLLGRTTALVLLLQAIASLKVFDQIFIMTGGGPDGSTRASLNYIYDTGFTDYRVGYASAAAVLFFLFVLAVSLVWARVNRRAEDGNRP
ncbi:carbohydrate ABC transporter permease [Streptomyces sp. NPDC060194]|uniref:carbohydrate ABC transporter permease n=1 Tax=Streptomyces sp. NPDC060194 TaxID=3347069 RepID=UPI0036641DDE